ncbi:hypothetical protein ACFQ9H_39275 [Streptomyces sp. NPDC056517]|uniref:hypothetical protein n=1 Tax=Streptomyces sp. NPDC056517 TaxID=3345848 RepID=UPI0036AB3A21
MDTRTNMELTVRGIGRAEDLVRQRSSPGARMDFALNELLAAAMDDFPDCRIGIADFVLSPRAVLLDVRLETKEVERAAEYLVKVGLAVRHSISPASWGAAKNPTFELTVLGIQCGERHPINVRNYVTEQQSQQPNFTFNGPTQVGNHNTQNNTFGHDPNQLAQFARELLAAADSTDITDTARARITSSVEILEGELVSANPEPGKLRQFFENTKQAALENLPALTVQTLFAAVCERRRNSPGGVVR